MSMFIGLSTVDIEHFVDSYPQRNQKTYAQKTLMFVGGPATNAAITFSMLSNNPTTLITKIGDNGFTQFIEHEFQKYNINVIDVVRATTYSPPLGTVIVSGDNGDRTITISKPHKQSPVVPVNEIDIAPPAFVLTDGFFFEELVEPVLNRTSYQDIPVIFDGGSYKDGFEAMCKYIDIAIVSEQFEIPGVRSVDTLQAIKDLGVDLVARTRGGLPIQYLNSTASSIKEIEVVPLATITDTLAAGDIFHGAFCFYYSQGHIFKTALKHAASIARESCKHYGPRKWINHVQLEPNMSPKYPATH